jgi:uncharacterized membrane protein YdbT with pleckstrin-like domain
MIQDTAHPGEAPKSIFQIERPDSKLWPYYILSSFLAGPFFFVVLIPLYFRYRTLRYKFDREGISMGWGILFRREIHLTYSRIQDIHLVANIVERWLGLARIQIQTASGSAKAEMTLEGLLEFEHVRDFLYSRMRGARDAAGARSATTAPLTPGDELATPASAEPFTTAHHGAHDGSDLAAVLVEVAAELRGVRLALESRKESQRE